MISIAHVRPQSQEDNWAVVWDREITYGRFADYNLKINFFYKNNCGNDNIYEHDILDLGEFSFEPTFKELAKKGIKKDIPVVSTCIEVLMPSLEGNCRKNNISKSGLSEVSHFIARTTWTRDLLYHFGIDSEKISVIPCACDLKTEPARCNASEPTFLYLGSLNRNKGFDIVLDEFEKLDTDVGFLRIVAGEFNNEEEYLKKSHLIRRAGVSSFPGIRNLNKIYDYIDVVVYLGSFHEPLQFGHPLLWGMSFGKALISLNQGGPKDMIEDGRNGFLCNSRAEIGEVMQYFIDNTDEIKKFGVYSRKKAENEFNTNIIAKEYNDVFRRLLNEN